MEDMKLKKFAIAKCLLILRDWPVKIYRFGNAYTVKDKNTNDTIFELKSAEFCNAENETGESCECLIVNREKLLVSSEGDKLLAVVKEKYEEQTKKAVIQEKKEPVEQPSILNYLDKYIRE